MSQLKPLFILILCLAACTHSKKELTRAQIDTTSQISTLDELLKNNPGDAYIYNRRAVLYLKKDDIKDALNDISLALKKDSMNPVFRTTLSDVYFAMSKIDKAKTELETVISIAPKDTVALMKLSKIYLYLQQYDLTYQTIDKLLELKPNGRPK